MNKIDFAIAGVLSCVSFASFAADAAGAEKELVAENSRGRWTFSAGPAWRSRVKMETSGVIFAPAPVARQTISRDMTDFDNWTDNVRSDCADPLAGVPGSGVPAGGTLWGATDTRTEIYGEAGRDYLLNASDTDAPLGLSLQGCYDFVQGETWSLGLNLRFAGYWNMKSDSAGRYNAGSTRTDVYTDTWVDENSISALPFGAGGVDPLDAAIVKSGEQLESRTVDGCGTRAVTTRLRSDLYQIGLGPKVTWTPFAGVCGWMEWLDVYGGVEILCNLAHTEFDADRGSSTQTDCLLGFGGDVGLVGNITDWLGIYGQVGYEWIDGTDVSAGGFNSEIDYSSLVLSAGLQFRF